MLFRKNFSSASKAAKSSGPDMDWFIHDRLGLFIHWGLYALPARHEWVMHNERISPEKYRKYFDHFDPDLYNPKEWARAASKAGMKYFCITTKHHEGFCLWDTKLTDYKATNTPYGRDLLGPMVKAFREEGLRTGLYHSLIDWHHPDYEADDFFPAAPEGMERKEFLKSRAKADQQRYIRYLHGQVRELLTQFGKVDYLFFDYSYEPQKGGKGRSSWDSEKLVKMIRKLQPGIIINDRLDLKDVPGGWDVKTPEQNLVREWVTAGGRRVTWETCQTFSGSWGYHRDECTWKSVRQLLAILIETVGKGGNLLLNVGPTGRGQFDERAMQSLEGLGKWMKLHGRSIYGCTEAPEEFPAPKNCFLTYNPVRRRLYVHVMDWRFKEILLDGFAGKVEYAQLLNDASEIQTVEPEDVFVYQGNDAPKKSALRNKTLTLKVPVRQPDVEIPVIELFLKA